MRVLVAVEGGGVAVIGQLVDSLRRRPELAQIEIARGRVEVRSGQLGATEVLTFVTSNVILPLVLAAIYDFFRDRRRSRPAERPRVVLTRTDLPDGYRRVELNIEGPQKAVVELARTMLEAPESDGRGDAS